MTIRWTKRMDKLLGTKADIAIAAKLDISLATVSIRRRLLKIPPHRKFSKPRKLIERIPTQELGTVPDSVLSKKYKLSPQRIEQLRKKHNIPSFRSTRK